MYSEDARISGVARAILSFVSQFALKYRKLVATFTLCDRMAWRAADRNSKQTSKRKRQRVRDEDAYSHRVLGDI